MAADSHALLGRLMDEHGKRHQRFQARYRESCEKLLAAVLPNIDPATLAKLTRAGFGFSEELLSLMHNDRQRCEEELAALAQQSAGESEPESGAVSEELVKLEGHLDALKPFLKKCFQHPRFDSLLLEGYGTDEYPKRFWHLSYYMDRRAAKEIEELCDGRSFANIRQEAVQALEASQVLKQRIGSLKERQRATATVARQRKTLQDRLRRHPQLWLAFARRKLRDLLEADPVGNFEKCRTLAAEESFEWRLCKELLKEHWDLETRFLKPAREAQQNGLRGSCQKMLEQYETLAEAMKRFDQPAANQEAIDWNALIYRDDAPT